MEQSDSDYLKGFTLLQSKDALGESWALLKLLKATKKCAHCKKDLNYDTDEAFPMCGRCAQVEQYGDGSPEVREYDDS